ncbi:MAG: LysR family transcriptional regulator [Nevskia sp.]|nr:LysR family transcriptional regulator [Nevskia sp.]
MRVTLRQLEVFCAICQGGGVTAAAAAVAMSQSAASQALADLESALDGLLFQRAGRRLILNNRGRALLPRALELLERATEIEAQLREGAALPIKVRLAASLTIGNYLLPALISRFLAQRPQASVELAVANTGSVIEAVAAFRADAGFIEGTCHDSDLISHPWREDELVVIAAPTHPLARKRRIAAADLGAAQWVLREVGSGTREVFVQAAQHARFDIRNALTFGHNEAVQAAVIAGAGLGCLSKSVVGPALRRGELKALRTPFLDLRRPLHLVLHRRRYVGASLRAVLAACGAKIG